MKYFDRVENIEEKVESVGFKSLTHYHTMTPFDAPGKQAL